MDQTGKNGKNQKKQNQENSSSLFNWRKAAWELIGNNLD
jgi:hypothetical protein